MIITEEDFFEALRDGRLKFVGEGCERGYVSRSRYPRGRFCGKVKRGRRCGQYKYQPSGYGHNGSTIYCVNMYYVEEV